MMPGKLKEGFTVEMTLCFKEPVVEKLKDKMIKPLKLSRLDAVDDETFIFKELSICKEISLGNFV